jgi:hypothetical protein
MFSGVKRGGILTALVRNADLSTGNHGTGQRGTEKVSVFVDGIT